MKIDSLQKLLIHELKDLYSAETQIIDALPKMEEAASNEELKSAFREHLDETRAHKKRLESVFEKFEFQPGGEHCDGADGLIQEAQSVIKEIDEGSVRDAALIGAAQRVEHYEMAGYGTAIAFARKLGHNDVADTLTETLEEEGKTDRGLTRLAEKVMNFQALVAS